MAQPKPRRIVDRRTDMSVVNPHAAGIDVGAQFHVVAVGPECAEESVRSFRSFTTDLHELARWLRKVKVTTVVMESTGIYWIPLVASYGSCGRLSTWSTHVSMRRGVRLPQ
jgi:transposase